MTTRTDPILQEINGERMRTMGKHLIAEQIDRSRDREFYDPGDRFITFNQVEELADLLVGTDDSVELGLSQIGLDPDELSADDFEAVRSQLEEFGVQYDEENDCWARD